jgi:hypothetical protein
MSPSIDPIGPWPLMTLGAIAVVVLTILAYQKKLRSADARWPWVAFGLRMAAVALCIAAAFRPSLLLLAKVKQTTSVLFLIDSSGSMSLGGQAAGQTRLAAARKTLETGLEAVKSLGPDVLSKSFSFDAGIKEVKPEELLEAKGRVTAVGTAIDEVVKLHSASKILRVVVLSDGASNSGPDASFVASTLRGQGIPIVTVGFGSEAASAENRDVAVRDLETGRVVYAKTQIDVHAKLDVRGYAGEMLDIELYAEGKASPVARVRRQVPEAGRDEFVLSGLKWTPETPGETKLTLKVTPMKGELLTTNNESSTFVTVIKGGINVLYIQGPSSPWEKKFLARALDASDKIQLTLQVLFEPAGRDIDAEFLPGKYDVYILGDLPADFLSREQRRLLTEAVRKGAGLMMLGGRSSFAEGGWAGSELAEVLPVELHPGDGQIEPNGGIRVIPNTLGLDSYVLRLSHEREANKKLWDALPAISGINRFEPKRAALLWAVSPQGDPILAALNAAGRGRSIAFAGETWPWARFSDESRIAHVNFWRNAILWLARKEDEGDTQVRLELDRRRVALGQKLELSATAKTGQGTLIEGVEYKTTVTRDAPDAKPEPISLFMQSEAARGSYTNATEPGVYTVEVNASKDGEPVGKASARFLIYDDDRELRRTAADLSLLRTIATESDGAYLVPEQLADYLKKLDKEIVADYVTRSELKLWDNWPYLLLFTFLLTAEWWLRKRHGWV